MVKQTSTAMLVHEYLDNSDNEIIDTAVSDGVMTIDVDCKDEPGPGFIIAANDEGLIMFRKFVGFKKSAINSKSFAEKINECNNNSFISNWGYAVLGDDDDKYIQLNVKSYHIGFDSKVFEEQLKMYNKEVVEGMGLLTDHCEGEGFGVLRGISY